MCYWMGTDCWGLLTLLIMSNRYSKVPDMETQICPCPRAVLVCKTVK